MAPSNTLMLVFSCCFLFSLVVARQGHTLDTSQEEGDSISHHYHIIQISSLLPSSTCSPSTKGHKKRVSLKVVHKHGPCSKLNEGMMTMEEIFSHDQLRVNSIRSRLTIKKGDQKDIQDSKVTIPAKDGSTIGSGNYIVKLGFGTPKKDFSLIFDTGSSLTWIQCEPCAGQCYSQQEPIFEPSASTTYSNISCSSNECSGLLSPTGKLVGCSSSTCVYGIEYGDGSISLGFFAKEKLTLSPTDTINDFYFGCGQANDGLFNGSAGLIGLGLDKISLVSQTATKYGKVFSYCLPSTSSSTGYLTFGSSEIAKNVVYTRLSTSHTSLLYGLDLQALYVGGKKVDINPSVFTTSGMIIDSGTVITRLPPTAYSALSKAFRAEMTQYPLIKPISKLFDTCYDFSNFSTIEVPKMSILWDGNAMVDIAPQGVFFARDKSHVCFAFAANEDDSDIGIFGNVQQKTLEVVYDVAAGKVGFGAGGCA